MYKQDYSKYFNKNNNDKKGPKVILKQIWKWTKIVLFLFVLISMLWGCSMLMMKDYQISAVTDMAGNKIYSPGFSFEIIIRALGDSGWKNHWLGDNGGQLSEYKYTIISNWGESFTVTKSPFYGFFVYPLAFVLIGFLRLFSGTGENTQLLDYNKSNYGVSVLFAIFVTSLLVRLLTLGFTWKTQKNQENMQAVTAKQAEIQAKYGKTQDPLAKQKMRMEISALYKKEGVNPLGSMVSSLWSAPFLLAMFSIVRATRALKVASIGEISLIEQPWAMIQAGNWVYLSLIVVYLPLQILSMTLPLIFQSIKQKGKNLTEAQRKSRKKQWIMQIVFVIVFVFIVFTIASGVAIYWIFSSTFMIVQTTTFHFLRETKGKRLKKKREKKLLKEKNKYSN